MRKSLTYWVLAIMVGTLLLPWEASSQQVSPAERDKPDQSRNTPRAALYDDVTDAYLARIIKRADTLYYTDPNAAVALLIAEQKRLDARGMGHVPLANGVSGPAIPSPLVLALATLRRRQGQEPTELIEYYQYVTDEYPQSTYAFDAAAEAVIESGFHNAKAWKWLNETFGEDDRNTVYSEILKSLDSKLKRTVQECRRELAMRSDREGPNVDGKMIAALSTPPEMDKSGQGVEAIIKQCVKARVYQELDRLVSQFPKHASPKVITSTYAALSPWMKENTQLLMWQLRPQWHEFNLSNRLSRAYQLLRERKSAEALDLYDSILQRYQDEQDRLPETAEQLLRRSASDHILVYVEAQDYRKALQYTEKYRNSYFNGITAIAEVLHVLELACVLATSSADEARILVDKYSMTDHAFSTSDVFRAMPADDRSRVEEFGWGYCPQWRTFNMTRRLSLAETSLKRGRYGQAAQYYAQCDERYGPLGPKDQLRHVLAQVVCNELDKDALPEVVRKILEGQGEAMHCFACGLFLRGATACIQTNALRQAESILNAVHTAVDSDEETPKVLFFSGYCQLLTGQLQEDNVFFETLIDNYPKSIFRKKAVLVWDIKEQLVRTHDSGKRYDANALEGEAKKCLQAGRINEAVGFYTNLLVEYPENTHSAHACYCIGYYHLLRGRLDLAKHALALYRELYPRGQNAEDVALLSARIEEMAQ